MNKSGKNEAGFAILAIVLVAFLLYFSGIIKLGATVPTTTFEFDSEGLHWICTSSSSNADDGDFSDGIISRSRMFEHEDRGCGFSASIIPSSSGFSASVSSSGVGICYVNIDCHATNFTIANYEKGFITLSGSGTISGNCNHGGASIDAFGISRAISYSGNPTSQSFTLPSLSKIEYVNGRYIIGEKFLDSLSFSLSASNMDGSCSSQDSLSVGIDLVYPPLPIVINQDCKTLRCSIGTCQADGTCLYTDIITNTSIIYQIVNNTVYVPVTQIVNNTVYVPINDTTTVYVDNTPQWVINLRELWSSIIEFIKKLFGIN